MLNKSVNKVKKHYNTRFRLINDDDATIAGEILEDSAGVIFTKYQEGNSEFDLITPFPGTNMRFGQLVTSNGKLFENLEKITVEVVNISQNVKLKKRIMLLDDTFSRGIDFKNVRGLLKLGDFNITDAVQMDGRIQRIQSHSGITACPDICTESTTVVQGWIMPHTSDLREKEKLQKEYWMDQMQNKLIIVQGYDVFISTLANVSLGIVLSKLMNNHKDLEALESFIKILKDSIPRNQNYKLPILERISSSVKELAKTSSEPSVNTPLPGSRAESGVGSYIAQKLIKFLKCY